MIEVNCYVWGVKQITRVVWDCKTRKYYLEKTQVDKILKDILLGRVVLDPVKNINESKI